MKMWTEIKAFVFICIKSKPIDTIFRARVHIGSLFKN